MTSKQELEKMAKEWALVVLYHNKQYRIFDATKNPTGFHDGNGHFTGTATECLIWLAGYIQGRALVRVTCLLCEQWIDEKRNAISIK